MKLSRVMVVVWCLACCVLALGGCSGSAGGANEGGTSGSVKQGRIELPPPEPVPGITPEDWAPPPVWLVSGARIVQASYGEFCKLDECIGMESPEQMGEDLAAMRISEDGGTYVVVGSGRVSGFAAGTKRWDSEVSDSPVPGVYTEPGVPPGMRALDARHIPEGAKPIVVPAPRTTPGETTGPELPSGSVSVYKLASTGRKGDRRLSVFLEINQYDRAVYHWRLDPGQEPESTSSETSSETTSATIEEVTSPGETTALPRDAADRATFQDVRTRSTGRSPTSVAAGEGHLWVLDRRESGKGAGSVLLKLAPGTAKTLSATEVPGASSGLEAGAGAVWLINEETGSVLRLDPASGEVKRRIHVGGSPSEVVTSEGMVWVAVSDGERSGRVVKINPHTNRADSEIETPGAIESIAVDDGTGDVWTAIAGVKQSSEDLEDGQLLRIDPGSNEISLRLKIPGGVTDAAAGGGAVWATNPQDDLMKINPSENRIEGVTPLGTPGPYEMEYGAGAVWIAGINHLIRVDSGSGIARSVETGPYGAEDVTVGENYAWAVGPGAGQGGTLTQVTP